MLLASACLVGACSAAGGNDASVQHCGPGRCTNATPTPTPTPTPAPPTAVSGALDDSDRHGRGRLRLCEPPASGGRAPLFRELGGGFGQQRLLGAQQPGTPLRSIAAAVNCVPGRQRRPGAGGRGNELQRRHAEPRCQGRLQRRISDGDPVLRPGRPVERGQVRQGRERPPPGRSTPAQTISRSPAAPTAPAASSRSAASTSIRATSPT